MSVGNRFSVHRTDEMTAVRTDVLADKNLSFGARGLYAFMQIPGGWLIYGDTEENTDKYIDELAKHGLIEFEESLNVD